MMDFSGHSCFSPGEEFISLVSELDPPAGDRNVIYSQTHPWPHWKVPQLVPQVATELEGCTLIAVLSQCMETMRSISFPLCSTPTRLQQAACGEVIKEPWEEQQVCLIPSSHAAAQTMWKQPSTKAVWERGMISIKLVEKLPIHQGGRLRWIPIAPWGAFMAKIEKWDDKETDYWWRLYIAAFTGW